MGAPSPLSWFADAIENTRRRFHESLGAASEKHSLAPDTSESAVAKIWRHLKALAGRRHDQDARAPAPLAEQLTLAVRVVFMGDLPSIIGQRGLHVTLPQGATVGQLFESLSATFGEVFTSRVFRGPAKLHPTMLVLVDGENINGLLAAKLGNSEVEVIMLPIIEGG